MEDLQTVHGCLILLRKLLPACFIRPTLVWKRTAPQTPGNEQKILQRRSALITWYALLMQLVKPYYLCAETKLLVFSITDQMLQDLNIDTVYYAVTKLFTTVTTYVPKYKV